MLTKIRRFREKVRRNKIRLLAWGFTASSVYALLLRGAVKDHNRYLKQKGLYEDYYQPDE